MNDIKPIKTKQDYDEAMMLLESLIELDPVDGSEESDRIAILSALIEDYENDTFPDHHVDPIEAIRFRMEQLNLKSIDLAPYLGGKSRVSEILSGKRSLTVKMVKNLEEGLGIPASSLIGSTGANTAKRWTPRLLRLMLSRGYFGSDVGAGDVDLIVSEGRLKTLLNSVSTLRPALLRQTNYRDDSSVDKQLLGAWLAKVTIEARSIIGDQDVPVFQYGDINWINDLVKLSTTPDSPIQAIQLLRTKGIVVVVEPPLPSTRLDGAMMPLDGRVVIGMTLRHDRLDNFWFTLMHEVAHAALHCDRDDVFFDNLESSFDLLDQREKEADAYARNALIPEDIWSRSPIRRNATPMIIKAFAKKIGVDEAIVAGRLRYEGSQWTRYAAMVNGSTVRQFFGDKIW